MADSFEAGKEDKSSIAVPAIPSSSSEISVRTMASDIELMGKAGGMPGQNISLGQVERVAVSTEAETEMSPTGVPAAYPTSPDHPGMRAFIWVILVIVIGAGLFALGFYLYPLFVK